MDVLHKKRKIVTFTKKNKQFVARDKSDYVVSYAILHCFKYLW
jgi:hypothetical protein